MTDTPKKPEKKYTEIGEPSNKGFVIGFIAACVLVIAVFAYFMIFKFQDTFYEPQVVQLSS